MRLSDSAPQTVPAGTSLGVRPDVSVILPVFNESQNIWPVLTELVDVLKQLDVEYEIIAVDDASRDDSFDQLRAFKMAEPRIRAMRFQRNYGQTAALNAGIGAARGEIIVLMDCDLENDAHDIPTLLDKVRDGFDVVSGWRVTRWRGRFLSRRLPSVLANKLISFVSGVRLHDYGCTLKAYRRDVIQSVMLYGEMHRFIPVYTSWRGGRVAEVPVSYRPRVYGTSKYGLFRIYKVLLDLLFLAFMDRYMAKPMHFFGGAGLLSLACGFLTGLWAVYYKVTGLKSFVATPLPVITSLLILLGILFILIGIIAELIIRVYFESQGLKPYSVAEIL